MSSIEIDFNRPPNFPPRSFYLRNLSLFFFPGLLLFITHEPGAIFSSTFFHIMASQKERRQAGANFRYQVEEIAEGRDSDDMFDAPALFLERFHDN